METTHSTARYLASSIAANILDAEVFDDEFILDLPRDIISRLTGKPFKKIYDNTAENKLACLTKALSLYKDKPLPNIPFDKNLRLLTSTLQLPDHCIPVLRLCVLTTLNDGLYALLDEYLQHWVSDINILVSYVLNITIDKLSNAIQLISETSMFKQHRSSIFGLLIMPYALANNLLSKTASTYADLLDGMYHQTTPTQLTIADYPHLELGYVSKYLKQTIKEKNVGVNILLHGAAGTGKTELAKVLSKYTKSQLVAVKAVGESMYHNDDELTSSRNVAHLRLQHYRLMQNLFNSDESTCLLLDEVEDVFTEYLNGIKVSKEKLHEVLESNTTPCFWITNHVDMLPDSVIRRMNYVIEVPPPPKHIKADILSKPLKGLRLSQDYKNQLATIPDLTPAHVVNASRIASALHLKGKDAEQCIDHHIDQCLSACGLQTSVANYKPEMVFDPRFINLTGSYTKIENVLDTVTNFTGARCLLLGACYQQCKTDPL